MNGHSDQDWERINCPVCDGDTFSPLFEKDNEPFVQCDTCTLVLINPRPVFKEVINTYTDDYSKAYAKKADKKQRRSLKRVRMAARLLDQPGRWLDVGCSAGFVVQAANACGFDGWGVDVEPWGIEYAKEHLQLNNLYHGMLEEQNFPDRHFKVISLYDVIEHVPDLNRLVGELARLLDGNGLIDIVTPDVGHWRVTRPLSEWKEIKPSEHLYYFSKQTLDRLFERHGLRIIRKRFSLKSSMKIVAAHQ
ncbi:MAG: class I SAM-dependent methyltransferase [Thiotrichales bacterium]|nr:class I SAM-dependent methyltransferase [Thiotrichales bacterium]